MLPLPLSSRLDLKTPSTLDLKTLPNAPVSNFGDSWLELVFNSLPADNNVTDFSATSISFSSGHSLISTSGTTQLHALRAQGLHSADRSHSLLFHTTSDSYSVAHFHPEFPFITWYRQPSSRTAFQTTNVTDISYWVAEQPSHFSDAQLSSIQSVLSFAMLDLQDKLLLRASQLSSGDGLLNTSCSPDSSQEFLMENCSHVTSPRLSSEASIPTQHLPKPGNLLHHCPSNLTSVDYSTSSSTTVKQSQSLISNGCDNLVPVIEPNSETADRHHSPLANSEPIVNRTQSPVEINQVTSLTSPTKMAICSALGESINLDKLGILSLSPEPELRPINASADLQERNSLSCPLDRSSTVELDLIDDKLGPRAIRPVWPSHSITLSLISPRLFSFLSLLAVLLAATVLSYFEDQTRS